MKKLFTMVGIVAAVIFAYVIMLGMQDATNTIVATANASGNWTGFESTQGAILSFPLWQWFIPGFVGMVMMVIVWKSNQ